MITSTGRSDSQPSVPPFVSPRTRRRTRDLRAARAQHGRERQRTGELFEREPGDDSHALALVHLQLLELCVRS
ncbi:uncharacterized [Tachysurus ichikawai]